MPDAPSQWAAPGAETLQTPLSAPVVVTAERGPDEQPLPPPPVDFGPMTVADVMDGAFEIIKRRPAEIAVIAAVAILPLQVVLTIVFRDYFSSDVFSLSVDTGDVDSSEPTVSVAEILMVQIATAVSLAWTCGAISVLVADWYRGIRRSVTRTLRIAAVRVPSLLVGVGLVKIAELVGMVGIVVGAVVVMAGLHVVSPVIALETRNPFTALARSFRLTFAQPGRSLVLPLVTALVGTVVSAVVGLLTGFFAELMPIEYAWIVVGSGQLISNMIVLPFTAGVAALYYIDLRVRREGLDIEEKARVVFGA